MRKMCCAILNGCCACCATPWALNLATRCCPGRRVCARATGCGPGIGTARWRRQLRFSLIAPGKGKCRGGCERFTIAAASAIKNCLNIALCNARDESLFLGQVGRNLLQRLIVDPESLRG